VFPLTAPAPRVLIAASQVEVTLSCAAWGWEASDVFLYVGALPANAVPPSIESGREVLGCDFKLVKVVPVPVPPVPPTPPAPPAPGAASSSANGAAGGAAGAAGSTAGGVVAPPAPPVVPPPPEMIPILVKAPRDLQKGDTLTFEHAGRRFTTRLPTFAKQVRDARLYPT